MKILCLVVILVSSASFTTAQVQPEQSVKPDLIVQQKKWRMEVRNAALDEDPFEVQKDRDREELERRDREKLNEKLNEQGMPTRQTPNRKPATMPGGLNVEYIYELKIRNAGNKDVRTIAWDYVFFDPTSKHELGRRRFVSKVRIKPGKTRNVIERSSTSPTGTIDATKADKKPQDMYSEQVIIQSIGFADGSEWKAAAK